ALGREEAVDRPVFGDGGSDDGAIDDHIRSLAIELLPAGKVLAVEEGFPRSGMGDAGGGKGEQGKTKARGVHSPGGVRSTLAREQESWAARGPGQSPRQTNQPRRCLCLYAG